MSNTIDFDALRAELATAASQRYHMYFLGSPLDDPRTEPIGFGFEAKDFANVLSWVESVEVEADVANPQILFTDPNPVAQLINATRVHQVSVDSYNQLLQHVLAAPVRHCL